VKVKRPFISSSYININSPCIFHLSLEQECRNPPFTFTLHYPKGLQIGKVPETCGNFLWAYRNLPGPGVRKGRWGRGFSSPPARLRGSLGGRQGHQGARVYPAADRLPTRRWSGFRGYLDLSSAPPNGSSARGRAQAMSHKPITVIGFVDTLRRHAVN
jgi:hypothetical protein